MIYLDNSATTAYKPESVKKAALTAMEYLSANAGRSGHSKSVSAAMLVYRTRNKLADMLGCDGDVAFGLNCTEALNLALLGSVRQGGHVVTTVYEHNSVLRPLFELQNAGKITVSVARPDRSGRINVDAVKPLIKKNTYLVAVNHVSNVTGAQADVSEIGKFLSPLGIDFLVDGAQSVGYLPIDMKKDGITYLAVAPHKGLHALQGVGALCIRSGKTLKPIKFGGTGTQSLSLLQPAEPPECYESGTLPLVAIAALNRSIDWCKSNFEKNRAVLSALREKAVKALKKVPRVRIYGEECGGSIVCMNILGFSSESVCDALDKNYGIAARGGLHCAPLVHRYLGTTESGAVRLSLGCDNTENDIDLLVTAVKEIAST